MLYKEDPIYIPSRFLVTQHVGYISGRLCMNCSLS